MSYFHINTLGLTAILASYYLTYSIFQIPAGILLDRYPTHWVLSIAVIICVVGSLIFIGSTRPELAELGRMIVGAGSAFSFIGVLKIIRDYLPAKYFGRMVGIAIALGTLAACYAETVTLKLAVQGSFLNIFYIGMLVGLVLAFILWGVLKFSYQAPLTEDRASWTATWLDIRNLLRHRGLWINALVGGLFYAPTSIIAALSGTYFLSTQYALSLSQSAFCISLLFIGWVVGSPITGYFSDKYENELSIMRVSAMLAFIVSILIIYVNFLNALYIASMMFLLGFFSSSQILVWKIFNKIAPNKIEGAGAAMTNMLIMLTVGACQLSVGYIMNRFISHPQAYHFALSIIPLCLLVSIFLSYYLHKNKPMACLVQ
jgi:MFS family permease